MIARAPYDITEPEVRPVPVVAIRRDGHTQHRLATHERLIKEFSALMLAGVLFPPVRVWWDGDAYWLSDGFRRVAAAERAGLQDILAEIRPGSLDDARWDSYAANATHGVRRTTCETRTVIRLALQHPNASRLSTVELARHLHLPEATVRRWRKKLSSSPDEDTVRVVRRGQTVYELTTRHIGKSAKKPGQKSRVALQAEVNTIKAAASADARRLFTILGNWISQRCTHTECLSAVERLLKSR